MLSPRSFLYTNPRLPRQQQPNKNKTAASSTPRTENATPTRPGRLSSSATASIQRISLDSKYDEPLSQVTVTVTPRSVSSSSAESLEVISRNMGMRKEKREPSRSALSTSHSAAASNTNQPITHTTPVQIPKHGNHENLYAQRRHGSHRRKRPMEMHTPDSLSPSLAALLAVTDIPRQRPGRRRVRPDGRLTVDEVIDDQQVLEKDLSWSMSRGTMDMLLSPPDDSLDDDGSVSDSNMGSVLSTRTISMDSIPSLGGSSMTDYNSFSDARSGSSPSRRRASSLRRSYLEPIRSPPDSIDDHPLSDDGHVSETEDDQSQAEEPEVVPEVVTRSQYLQTFKPLRAVFKSNLTASLRALRSAAKSFSSLNFPAIPADDLLARSMLTIDANVPFTDERRPPVTEEPPSAELRRYLNPSPSRDLESRPGGQKSSRFSASIQMQTYKIQRSRSAPPALRTAHSPHSSGSTSAPLILDPGMRQREMRENSDFIRVAVMEMAMRRRGKLDDQRPGRARWALPPRKTSMKPYQVGPDGVPVRWVPVNC